MIKIFKQLGRHWVACLAVVALLIVQANCDLALPGYTSDIVDVGIQQGGIESPLPETLRPTTLQALQLMMSVTGSDEAATTLLQNAYLPGNTADSALTLREDLTEDERATLESALTMPDVALYMASAQVAAQRLGTEATTPEPQDLDAAIAGLSHTTAMVSGNVMQNQFAQMMDGMDQATADTLADQSVLLVGLEYKAQGKAEQVQLGYLYQTGLRMLAFSLLMVAAAVLVGLIASRTSAAIGRDLRRSVFNRVVNFSNAEIDRFSTASLITRTTNDIQQVQQTSVMMLRMVAYAPILAVGGIIRVSQTKTGLSWIIAVAVVALLSIVFVLMRVALPKFKIMQTLVDQLNLVSREILTGIMPIRAFSREKYEEKRFDKASTDLMQTQLFTNRVMTFMMPLMMMMMNLVTLMIVWFGGKRMDANGMQIGELIAFITYTMQIVMSFLMLTGVSIMLPRAGVAADRIDEVLATEPTVEDAANPCEKTDWQGVVEFQNVAFRYPGAESDALEDITFTARPGETTAIIGTTGCGKSTLLNLIPRFYDVTGGSVTIDGVDVRDIPQHTLHALLGYVPQKGVLFSGSIASNLRFGTPDLSDDAMHRAAQIAQAEPFINEKEQGYDSPIAQGGNNVSGGQKQRLSIARAIAVSPKIYLFDDSFSALDYKTDVALRRALKEQTDNATVIIVAQRISTVLHANRILVLDDGRIVGSGTHAQLMESCAEYQEIARSQLSEKELNTNELNHEAKKGGEQ